MASNPYFNRFKNKPEQNLSNDLTAEAIKQYAHDVYYLPRTIEKNDDVLNEPVIQKFSIALPVELYIKNYSQFEGQGQLLSKFGLEIRDQMTFVLSKKSFEEFIKPTTKQMRPFEGDCIYIPMFKNIYQIKYTDMNQEFYILGDNYAWILISEILEFNNEQFMTGIPEIDNVNKPFENANDESYDLDNYDATNQNKILGDRAKEILGLDYGDANTTSYMLKSIYDPRLIQKDVFSRANHTGNIGVGNISGLGGLAIKNQVALEDIATTNQPSGDLFLRGDGVWTDIPVGSSEVPASRKINTINGIIGGGNLVNDLTLSLDANTTNSLLLANSSLQPSDLSNTSFKVSNTATFSLNNVDLSDSVKVSLAKADSSLQKGNVSVTDLNTTGTANGSTFLSGTGEWKLISGGGSGGGDMLKSVYDPTNVNADAFNMDSMNDGNFQLVYRVVDKQNFQAVKDTYANVNTFNQIYFDANTSRVTFTSSLENKINTWSYGLTFSSITNDFNLFPDTTRSGTFQLQLSQKNINSLKLGSTSLQANNINESYLTIDSANTLSLSDTIINLLGSVAGLSIIGQNGITGGGNIVEGFKPLELDANSINSLKLANSSLQANNLSANDFNISNTQMILLSNTVHTSLKKIDDQFPITSIDTTTLNGDGGLLRFSDTAQEFLLKAMTSLQPGNVAITDLNVTGTANSTTYLAGDGSWKFIQSGGSGNSSGDMLKSVYDPNNISSDSFNMDNMKNGNTNFVFSSTDKNNLANVINTYTKPNDFSITYFNANSSNVTLSNYVTSRIELATTAIQSGNVALSDIKINGGTANSSTVLWGDGYWDKITVRNISSTDGAKGNSETVLYGDGYWKYVTGPDNFDNSYFDKSNVTFITLNSNTISALSKANTAIQPGEVRIVDLKTTGTANSITYLSGDGSWKTISGGSGDMLKSTYDPTGVSNDAFNMDNMRDGNTNIVYTNTDKNTLNTINSNYVQPTSFNTRDFSANSSTVNLNSSYITAISLATTSVQPNNFSDSFVLNSGYWDLNSSIKSDISAGKYATQPGFFNSNDFDSLSNTQNIVLSNSVKNTLSLAQTAIQTGNVAISDIKTTGTANTTTYLRGDGIWSSISGGGSGGATKFTDLSDVPQSYSGANNQILSVKMTEDGLEFKTLSGLAYKDTITSIGDFTANTPPYNNSIANTNMLFFANTGISSIYKTSLDYFFNYSSNYGFTGNNTLSFKNWEYGLYPTISTASFEFVGRIGSNTIRIETGAALSYINSPYNTTFNVSLANSTVFTIPNYLASGVSPGMYRWANYLPTGTTIFTGNNIIYPNTSFAAFGNVGNSNYTKKVYKQSVGGKRVFSGGEMAPNSSYLIYAENVNGFGSYGYILTNPSTTVDRDDYRTKIKDQQGYLSAGTYSITVPDNYTKLYITCMNGAGGGGGGYISYNSDAGSYSSDGANGEDSYIQLDGNTIITVLGGIGGKNGDDTRNANTNPNPIGQGLGGDAANTAITMTTMPGESGYPATYLLASGGRGGRPFKEGYGGHEGITISLNGGKDVSKYDGQNGTLGGGGGGAIFAGGGAAGSWYSDVINVTPGANVTFILGNGGAGGQYFNLANTSSAADGGKGGDAFVKYYFGYM